MWTHQKCWIWFPWRCHSNFRSRIYWCYHRVAYHRHTSSQSQKLFWKEMKCHLFNARCLLPFFSFCTTYFCTLNVSFAFSMARYSLSFRFTAFPLNVIVISGLTGRVKWVVTSIQNFQSESLAKTNENLLKVVLLIPSPWIGSTRTRPEILYGPIKYRIGPFRLSTYFPSGFAWKPLKIWKFNFILLLSYDCNDSLRFYLILVNLKLDNPVKSTSVNFNSILTGLSAPCLIDILGTWSGSMGIRLIPWCPTFIIKWMYVFNKVENQIELKLLFELSMN